MIKHQVELRTHTHTQGRGRERDREREAYRVQVQDLYKYKRTQGGIEPLSRKTPIGLKPTPTTRLDHAYHTTTHQC